MRRTEPTRARAARTTRTARTTLESLERRTLFAAGDLDTAFGFGGHAAADFGDGNAVGTDLAADANRMVIVGTVSTDGTRGNLAVAAFRHDGTIDTSFSGDGKLLGDANVYPRGVAIRGDGKVVVSGSVFVDNRVTDSVVYRFNADGTPDDTFGGGDGKVSVPVAGALALGPGNRIVIGGVRHAQPVPSAFSVMRLNPDGSPDASLDGDGVVDHRYDTATETGYWVSPRDVAVQPDGKIVLVGTVYGHEEDEMWDGAAARINADGSSDNTFGGGDGRVIVSTGSVDDFATAVSIAPDNTILVGAIYSEYQAFAVRLSADGNSATRYAPFSVSDNIDVTDVYADARNRVVISGPARRYDDDPPYDHDAFLGRYQAGGTGFEPGFGGYATGRFVAPAGRHSAPAPDGGMLVAADHADDGALRVYRYLSEGGADASGTATLSNGTLTLTATTRDDEIRVEPGGAAGRVVTRVNGYERAFSGVSRISVSAGAGNDDVRISEQVTLPTTVSGGAGDDRIDGGGGNDRLDGGDGHDNFNGFAGNDEIISGAGGGSIRGGPGDDRLLGGAGSDTFYADAGADHVSGGGGRDHIDYGQRTADLRVSLDGVANDGEAGEGDNVLPDVEDVSGGDGDDLIVGSAADNQLLGGSRGDDTVRGLGGNDALRGTGFFAAEYGNDLLEGGDGDDQISSGGPGRPDGFSTTLLGGNGNDVLYVEPDDTYDAGPGNDTINGMREDGVPTSPSHPMYLDLETGTLHVNTRDARDDTVTLVRQSGGPARFPDTLVAVIRYADGNSRRVDVPYGDVRRIAITTEGGNDLVEMGLITIPAQVHLGEGNDSITAGMGNDTIYGEAGDDSINGNAGDDTIVDEAGNNNISGGLGTDTINGVRETPAGDAIYQAEDATVFGARVRSGHDGFTGSGYVDFDHARGDFIAWHVAAQADGSHRLTFRYANGSSDRPLQLVVNNQVVRSRLSLPGTGSWSSWRTVTVDVPLHAGSNQVVLQAIGFGGPNVDSLSVQALDQPPAADTWVLQGEDAASTPDDTTVRTTHSGYTGRGYLDFSRDSGANAQWLFDDLPGPGEYVVEFRYANGSPAPRTLAFDAGIEQQQDPITFAPTGSWSTWRTVSVPVTMLSGTELALTLTTTGADGPNIDLVTLRRVSAPQELRLQAEQAALVGARVKSTHAGFTGTGYADYDNPSGDSIEWAFEHRGGAGRSLTFRYANGGLSDRPLELRVNGQVLNARLSFAPTGSWSTWREVTVNVPLVAGTNRVRLTSVGSNGPNIDLLTVR